MEDSDVAVCVVRAGVAALPPTVMAWPPTTAGPNVTADELLLPADQFAHLYLISHKSGNYRP